MGVDLDHILYGPIECHVNSTQHTGHLPKGNIIIYFLVWIQCIFDSYKIIKGVTAAAHPGQALLHVSRFQMNQEKWQLVML